jgi:hypothetical protein
MEDVKKLQSGEKQYSFADYMADYCYWFVRKQESKARGYFLGQGGMVVIHLKGDPGQKPPQVTIPSWLSQHPAFRKIPGGADPNQMMRDSFSLLDPFLDKSKALFGKGLESDPQYEGLFFVIPLLTSQDFFNRPAEDVQQWFQLFDVYVAESPADQGIIIASIADVLPLIRGIVAEMRAEEQEQR